MPAYGEDLAFIHDAGFSAYCLGAAPGLLRILRSHGIADGLVADLGCGSGRWARRLNDAGYRVCGIDRSESLLRLARRAAPQSRFLAGSLWEVALPRCDAVTSLGECLNYAGDPRARAAPHRLFARVFAALRPGGVFVFDAATPDRIPEDGPRRHWTDGPGWAVLVETAGGRRRRTLTRRIVSFRRIGGHYRRREEVHTLRLYRSAQILEDLTRAGFDAVPLAGYGRFRFPHGIAGFVARKP
ncbi:MAG: methyltransferase domain-containing protein [Acidobacteriia bacterium]|nr:methyltransferase domain-containing protein [Terriglobia bacterium]